MDVKMIFVSDFQKTSDPEGHLQVLPHLLPPRDTTDGIKDSVSVMHLVFGKKFCLYLDMTTHHHSSDEVGTSGWV